MVVFSGDLDKLIAAFIISTGAVAMDMEVVIFILHTRLRQLFEIKRKKIKKKGKGKNLFRKMFSVMLPKE